MADLQDEIKKLEEERAKRIAEEERVAKEDAKKIAKATEDLTAKKLELER